MEEDKKWKNPTPVAVAIVPVEKHIQYEINGKDVNLIVKEVVYLRRGIEPQKGKLALPGGFVDELERLETGGARELREETGLVISDDDFVLFRSEITPNNRNLIFGITPVRSEGVIDELNHNFKTMPELSLETQGFVVGGLNVSDTAFPLHQKAVGKFLDKVNGDVVNLFGATSLDKNEVEMLVKRLKEDGYLTEFYQYDATKEMSVKFKI